MCTLGNMDSPVRRTLHIHMVPHHHCTCICHEPLFAYGSRAPHGHGSPFPVMLLGMSPLRQWAFLDTARARRRHQTFT